MILSSLSTMELFKEFKNVTQEEAKIVKKIKKNAEIKNTTTILDIGGNDGTISKKLQPNTKNITLIDIDEFDSKSGVKFIKSAWENAEIKEKFDIVIASHVWGHFGYSRTQQKAFIKAINSKKQGGKLFLCYNSNAGFLNKLIKFSETLFEDFQYDYFDETLLSNLKYKEESFSVKLTAESFERLAELCWVLIIADKEVYELKKKKIEEFLRKELDSPEFEVVQKIVIIS